MKRRRFLALHSEYKKAPVVTRERLYLDALEGVMSNTTKILLDTEGNNNYALFAARQDRAKPRDGFVAVVI